ncbi:MAG: aldehyde dehydrogenase family protein [Pseudomonadota bacterium]
MASRTIETFNPATGLPRAVFPLLDDAALEQRLETAYAATNQARQTALSDRLSWLENAARLLRERRPMLAAIMTDEMGKPLAAAEGEIEKCAWVCEFYAQNAESFLQDQTVSTSAGRSFVRPLSLGVILAVMPWNFPFWQVFRFAAPALAAGNVVLLKHAPNTFESASWPSNKEAAVTNLSGTASRRDAVDVASLATTLMGTPRGLAGTTRDREV